MAVFIYLVAFRWANNGQRKQVWARRLMLPHLDVRPPRVHQVTVLVKLVFNANN
ncbi:hypothetical protein SS05631_a46180 (plasmid) [Sinorhizobium sp. CCBAU 05631]|nr:hypothetical protein SS05631_a46180 [Sinorhizobium sp. CCBAU 05631]